MPAVLARQGIRSVSDNLTVGEVLDVGRAFAMVFRTELEARLIRVPDAEQKARGHGPLLQKPARDKGEKPCPSNSPCR